MGCSMPVRSGGFFSNSAISAIPAAEMDHRSGNCCLKPAYHFEINGYAVMSKLMPSKHMTEVTSGKSAMVKLFPATKLVPVRLQFDVDF